MIYIAHRGNITGKNINTENTVGQINYCLSINLDVEIDIWYYHKNLWLGHDEPKYKINENFLYNKKLWCHAKNSEALFYMSNNKNIHYFWHNLDNYTITSKGYLWALSGCDLNHQTICVLPENYDYSTNGLGVCAGICSDNIMRYKYVK